VAGDAERDRIYANPEATDDDYMRAAELEGKFAEYDGYTAEARAGAVLIDAGIDRGPAQPAHARGAAGPEAARAAGAGAVFAPRRAAARRADQQPRHPLDRLARETLNDYDATMIIISHDRHFLNQVCTHIADLDFQQLKIYPGNYDDFMLASVQARQRVEAANAKAKAQISDLQEFVRRFSANASKARQATSRKRQIEKIKIEEIKPLVAPEPVHPLRAGQEAVSLGRDRRRAHVPLSRAPTRTSSRTSTSRSRPSSASPSSARTASARPR
jgi:ATPase subunit of ABC transporter with duplicated ATPase domains